MRKRTEPPVYDDGESFAAGDADLPQFDNDRLRTLFHDINALIPDRRLRVLIWLVILKAIFREAEIRELKD